MRAKQIAFAAWIAWLVLVSSGCLGDVARDFVTGKLQSPQEDSSETAVAADDLPEAAAGAEQPQDQPPSSVGEPARPLAGSSTPPPRVEAPVASRSYQLDPSNETPDQQAAVDDPHQAQPGSLASGSSQLPLRLRTAVALPQSLPTGTAMGFSVEYQFVGAAPESRTQYVWVIKPPAGQPLESVVQLGQRGTLQTFITQWGPVTGSYEIRIDEVTRYGRRPISRPITAVYSR